MLDHSLLIYDDLDIIKTNSENLFEIHHLMSHYILDLIYLLPQYGIFHQ